MDGTVADVLIAVAELRRAQAQVSTLLSQADVVAALAELAARWRDPAYPPRREAEGLIDPFPFAMVRVSLEALLDSLTPAALGSLIDAEDVREARGYAAVGHVIAGNTPLLAWSSVIRALLMRSASFVKLPSGPAARWGRLFAQSLADVSPPLARCVHWSQWPGGTTELDAVLSAAVDLLIAHGSDQTIQRLRALCPPTRSFVGYGHRVSFGLVPRGTAGPEAAEGFATDILLYDQGGCLSPQTIFVEGAEEDAVVFAQRLAAVLPESVSRYPLPLRAAQAGMAVRDARVLARMGRGNRLWEDKDLRWTVIARPEMAFAPSPTYGVVSVQPLRSLDALPAALAPVAGHLQGCAAAGFPPSLFGSQEPLIPCLGGKDGAGFSALGVSYICPPGQLQAPPLAWRQDGRDVLRLLLPRRGQDNEGG